MAYRFVITLEEVKKRQKREEVILVDIREQEKYEEGHIPGAISVPYTEEQSFLERLERKKKTVLYCDRGNLSMRAVMRTRRAGYPVYSLAGGYEGYQRFQK